MQADWIDADNVICDPRAEAIMRQIGREIDNAEAAGMDVFEAVRVVLFLATHYAIDTFGDDIGGAVIDTVQDALATPGPYEAKH